MPPSSIFGLHCRMPPIGIVVLRCRVMRSDRPIPYCRDLSLFSVSGRAWPVLPQVWHLLRQHSRSLGFDAWLGFQNPWPGVLHSYSLTAQNRNEVLSLLSRLWPAHLLLPTLLVRPLAVRDWNSADCTKVQEEQKRDLPASIDWRDLNAAAVHSVLHSHGGNSCQLGTQLQQHKRIHWATIPHLYIGKHPLYPISQAFLPCLQLFTMWTQIFLEAIIWCKKCLFYMSPHGIACSVHEPPKSFLGHRSSVQWLRIQLQQISSKPDQRCILRCQSTLLFEIQKVFWP